MASKRKPFVARVKTRTAFDLFAAFIADLLSGAIKATHMVIGGSKHKPTISYDDPNG